MTVNKQRIEHMRVSEQGAKKMLDFIDSRITEKGEYFLDFDNVEQMNELAAYAGLPQCEHGRAFVAEVLRNPNDPDARFFALTKKTAA